MRLGVDDRVGGRYVSLVVGRLVRVVGVELGRVVVRVGAR